MKKFTVFTAFSLPLVWASPILQCEQEQDNFTVGQTVETSSGSVAGHAATDFSEVSEYLGIPFAQPPVGDLRFAAPVKYAGSSAINGSAFGYSCPGLPSSGSTPTAAEIAASNITAVGLELLEEISGSLSDYSEDCLYLNVWSKPQSGESQKAVMVFIHGGGFTGGTSASSIFVGASLVENEDVVIVTINYRLSILGWPGNPSSTNNLGFLDQRLALEWIRDNIANFGGDPSRITLFGQSAGAMSADFYSYGWASDPIVNGIILESGAVSSFGLPYSANTSATAWYSVTEAVGCGNASTDSTTLLSCMRDVDVDTILAAVPATGLYALLSAFGPTADNDIVFANYSQQTPANISVLIGNNDYEAGIFRTELALGNETFPDALWDVYDLGAWTCPAGDRANLSVAAAKPTWRYRYFGVYPNIDISSEGGAYHGAELPLLFGTTLSLSNATAEEVEFEAYMRGAWTTFAKDPVNGLTTYGGGWPSYDPSAETLIRLAYDDPTGTNLAFPMLYDTGCDTVDLTALLQELL